MRLPVFSVARNDARMHDGISRGTANPAARHLSPGAVDFVGRRGDRFSTDPTETRRSMSLFALLTGTVKPDTRLRARHRPALSREQSCGTLRYLGTVVRTTQNSPYQKLAGRGFTPRERPPPESFSLNPYQQMETCQRPLPEGTPT